MLNVLIFKHKLVIVLIVVAIGLIGLELECIRISFKHIPNGTIVWHGCLYKKANWLSPNVSTQCGRCVHNGTILAKNARKYYMKYINCTSECPQPTLCTEYKFNINGSIKSECYVCEAKTFEHVLYRAMSHFELCGKACRECAANADFATATSCSKPCKGKPTFCPPNQSLFFGQKICYQSKRLHGCHFHEVDRRELDEKFDNCVDCATRVTRRSSDICSPHCGSLPTWHKHNPAAMNETANSINGDPLEDLKFMRCKMPILGGVLDYEIPGEIRTFVRGLNESVKHAAGNREIAFVPYATLYPRS